MNTATATATRVYGYEIRMDFENNAEKFWENFNLSAANYDAFEYHGESWYFFDEKTAKKFWSDCEKIEGWCEPDMPEYAPTPLNLREITSLDQLPEEVAEWLSN